MSIKGFGHLERMNGSQLVNLVYSSECFGNRPIGKPKKIWTDSGKKMSEKENANLALAK